jgi:hypothetical protein
VPRTILIAICLFSAIMGRFCFLLRPLDNDAAIFIYMGKMVAGGGRLCHDLIDNKFPTVGLMTSILWKTLGICWPAYIALQTLLSLGSAWFLGQAARRVAGTQAKLPTMLFAIVFLNFTTAVFGGFQLETVQAFFTAIAVWSVMAVVNGQTPAERGANGGIFLPAFIAGLAAGTGAMLKPTAMGVLVAMMIAMVVQHRDLRRIITIAFATATGLAIPLIVTLLYLVNADLLRDMPALYHQISTYAHETVFDAVELIKPLAAFLLLGFPMMVRGIICRRHRDPRSSWPFSPAIVFAITWLIIETTGVILQRRMYAYHFLPMVPPAALLFGFIPRINRPTSLAAALLPIALLSIHQACGVISTTPAGQSPMPISRYLIDHTKPTDAVWMDAWPRLVLETGRQPASRLPFTFLFTNYDSAGLDYSAGVIADFERTKPMYIVLPVPLDKRMQYQIDFIPELNRRPMRQANYIAGWRRIDAYTLSHYTKETMIGNDAIYRRNP